jgi:hypothetical protein
MTNELDILNIDTVIQKNFQCAIEKLPSYKIKLQELKRSLNLPDIRLRIRSTLENNYKQLFEKIQNIENNTDLNFYLVESSELLEIYKKILEAPMKVNFMGRPIKNNKEKQKIIYEYLEIANKYTKIDINISGRKQRIVCSNCSNYKEFEIIDENIYVCLECSAQQTILKHVSSYKDINRVNISSKYMYDRKVHFRDCINQYQGKQNSTIPQKIYDDLEDQFSLHHLLIGDKSELRENRFKNITKEHISMFLKELDYTKHYENVNLIHYNFTGIKPDDIGYLEDDLLNDFDILTELYDRRFKHIDRKNFIHTQYVLFQLLTRHKHPCVKEDFTILKTVDRKSFHDDIIRALFEENGWNMSPHF